jgi:hypothetical protein
VKQLGDAASMAFELSAQPDVQPLVAGSSSSAFISGCKSAAKFILPHIIHSYLLPFVCVWLHVFEDATA